MTTSPASRKSAERQRRKDAGEVRVECWISKETADHLETVIRFSGYRLTQSEAIAHAIYVASRP